MPGGAWAGSAEAVKTQKRRREPSKAYQRVYLALVGVGGCALKRYQAGVTSLAEDGRDQRGSSLSGRNDRPHHGTGEADNLLGSQGTPPCPSQGKRREHGVWVHSSDLPEETGIQ